MASFDDIPFTLLPATEDFTADEELAGLVDPNDTPVATPSADDTIPFGCTSSVQFDEYDHARFGQRVDGPATVITWALIALRVQRGAHPDLFPPEYGRGNREMLIGKADSAELRALFINDVIETLLEHDRITDVGDFTFTVGDDGETLYVEFSIEIDGNETSSLEALVNA